MSDKSNSLTNAFKDRAPKANVQIEVERSQPIKGDSEPNQLVKLAGRRLAPETLEHVASYCVHIYRNPLSLNMAFVSQVLNADDLNERMKPDSTRANLAIQDLAIATAKTFGWTPSKSHKRMIKEK